MENRSCQKVERRSAVRNVHVGRSKFPSSGVALEVQGVLYDLSQPILGISGKRGRDFLPDMLHPRRRRRLLHQILADDAHGAYPYYPHRGRKGRGGRE
eukprot:736173-Hanusia_phi.AAC.2